MLRASFLFFLITFITNCPNPTSYIEGIIEKDIIHYIHFHRKVVKKDIVNYIEKNYYFYECSQLDKVLLNVDKLLDKICYNRMSKKGVKHYYLKQEYYSYYDPYYVKSESCNTFEKFVTNEFKTPFPLPVLDRYNKNIVNIIFTNSYNHIIIDTIKRFPNNRLIIEPVIWMIIVKINYSQMYNKMSNDDSKYSDSLKDLADELKDEKVVSFFESIMSLPYIKSILNYIFSFFKYKIRSNDLNRMDSQKITSRMNRIRKKKEIAIEKYLKPNEDRSYCYCKSTLDEYLVIPVNYQRIISYKNQYKLLGNKNETYPLFKIVIDNKMNIYHISCLEYQTVSYVLLQINTKEDSFFSSVDIEQGEFLIPAPLCYVYYNLCLLVPVNERRLTIKPDKSNSGFRNEVFTFEKWNFNGMRLLSDSKSTGCVTLFYDKFDKYEEMLICLSTTLTDLIDKMDDISFKVNGYELKCLLFNSQVYITFIM